MLGKYRFGLGQDDSASWLWDDTPAPGETVIAIPDTPGADGAVAASIFNETVDMQKKMDSILNEEEIYIPPENQNGSGGSVANGGIDWKKWAMYGAFGLAGIFAIKAFIPKKTLLGKVLDIVPSELKGFRKKTKKAEKRYKKKVKSGRRKAKKAKAAIVQMRTGASTIGAGARKLKKLSRKKK